jgi:hypothetical protein
VTLAMPFHVRHPKVDESIHRSKMSKYVTLYDKNNNEIGDLERLRTGHVCQRADLYWEWGAALRRRTSLDLMMACNARAARPVMLTASGHADLEGAYR